MGRFDLPAVITRENYEAFADTLIDPDAERFRYFGQALMSVASDQITPQAQTLRKIMELHQPATLEALRACIDAAKTLTP